MLFVGPVDQGVSFAVGKGVRDAGGTVVRTRSISVPLDIAAIEDALRGEPAFRATWARITSAISATPWRRSSPPAARHRSGMRSARSSSRSARALRRRLPMRSSSSARPEPQQGPTKTFLAGLYGGLARSGVPAVGTEASGTSPSAIPAFALAGLSTVDSVDTSAGRLGLVLLLGGARARAATASARRPTTACCRRSRPSSRRVNDQLRTVSERLTRPRRGAGRGGAESAATVEALRAQFPEAAIVVADDGSRDATAERRRGGRRPRDPARAPRQGPGADARRAAARAGPAPALRRRSPRRPAAARRVARPSSRSRPSRRGVGGGFGLAKTAARSLIRLRCGLAPREPLSGQRHLSARARAAVFPVAMGFGVETRMTIDAVRAGLEVEEIELDLEHRATGRDLRGFAHRGRQLADLVLACGPQAVNYRGLRLPLVGAAVGARGAGRRARRGDRARRRPLERAGARLPRPSRASGADDRDAEARRHPAVRARAARARCPARCSSALPRTPSTSSTPAPAGR